MARLSRPPFQRHQHTTAIAVVLLVSLFMVALIPGAVEHGYAPYVGYPISLALTGVTSRFGWSLAEWVEASAAVSLLLGAGWLVRQRLRHRYSWRLVLATLAWWLAPTTAVVGLLFYGSWGLHYARPAVTERLGWSDVEFEDIDEITRLADSLVHATNLLYEEVHGRPDALETTRALPMEEIDAATDRGWATATSAVPLPARMAVSRGPVKPLLSSPLFTRLGISGFYFPFTGEANVNTMPPGWQLPHTVAHEKAHQRGIASEDEANFYAFLACIHSESAFVRYGATLFAQRQILRVLLRLDSVAGVRALSRRHPGVQRDVDSSILFWTGYDGAMRDLGSAMNDAYLKLNQVEGGTLSYSQSSRLILGWSRMNPTYFPSPAP